jgi:hypothetical protein
VEPEDDSSDEEDHVRARRPQPTAAAAAASVPVPAPMPVGARVAGTPWRAQMRVDDAVVVLAMAAEAGSGWPDTLLTEGTVRPAWPHLRLGLRSAQAELVSAGGSVDDVHAHVLEVSVAERLWDIGSSPPPAAMVAEAATEGASEAGAPPRPALVTVPLLVFPPLLPSTAVAAPLPTAPPELHARYREWLARTAGHPLAADTARRPGPHTHTHTHTHTRCLNCVVGGGRHALTRACM